MSRALQECVHLDISGQFEFAIPPNPIHCGEMATSLTLSHCQHLYRMWRIGKLTLSFRHFAKSFVNWRSGEPYFDFANTNTYRILAKWQCQSLANAFRNASVTSRSIFSFCRSVSVPLPDLFRGSKDTLSFPSKTAVCPNDSAILVTVLGCSRPDSLL